MLTPSSDLKMLTTLKFGEEYLRMFDASTIERRRDAERRDRSIPEKLESAFGRDAWRPGCEPLGPGFLENEAVAGKNDGSASILDPRYTRRDMGLWVPQMKASGTITWLVL
jgi:hypothetical protein